MREQKNVYVFDFDGTLTSKDSMMEIILFQRGWPGLVWALARQFHLILLMMLKLYDNQKCKERLLGYCFGGMTETDFDNFCERFAAQHGHILNPVTMAKLEEARKDKDASVYVISASPEKWVCLFVPGVTVLGSKMEVLSGKITGKLCSRNCYGPEKVNRLLAAMPEIGTDRKDYYITAYGDSRGDREMIAFADRGVWVGRE